MSELKPPGFHEGSYLWFLCKINSITKDSMGRRERDSAQIEMADGNHISSYRGDIEAYAADANPDTA